MKNYKLSRLNHRAAFGVMEPTVVNGVPTVSYKEKFKLWYGDYKLSVRDKLDYQENLNMTATTKMIVIRHRDDIDPEMSVRIDGTEYNIKSVDSDPGINTFDVITMDLKK